MPPLSPGRRIVRPVWIPDTTAKGEVPALSGTAKGVGFRGPCLSSNRYAHTSAQGKCSWGRNSVGGKEGRHIPTPAVTFSVRLRSGVKVGEAASSGHFRYKASKGNARGMVQLISSSKVPINPRLELKRTALLLRCMLWSIQYWTKTLSLYQLRHIFQFPRNNMVHEIRSDLSEFIEVGGVAVIYIITRKSEWEGEGEGGGTWTGNGNGDGVETRSRGRLRGRGAHQGAGWVRVLLLTHVFARFQLRDKKTAFHMACDQGFLEIVQFMHSKDSAICRILMVDKKGVTPMHVAAQGNHARVVEFLLDKVLAWKISAYIM